MLGLDAAQSVIVAIAFLIWWTLALAMLVLPFVAIFLPAILVLVSRRGNIRTRLWVAAGCVVASATLFQLTRLVGWLVPSGLSREAEYGISTAIWGVGIVAPWIIYIAFLVRVARGGGPGTSLASASTTAPRTRA